MLKNIFDWFGCCRKSDVANSSQPQKEVLKAYAFVEKNIDFIVDLTKVKQNLYIPAIETLMALFYKQYNDASMYNCLSYKLENIITSNKYPTI